MGQKLLLSFAVTTFLIASSQCHATIRFGCVTDLVASGALSPSSLAKDLDRIKENLTPEQVRLNKKIRKKGLEKTAYDKKIAEWHARPFTVEITTAGKVTNQMRSGDCWDHATMNQLKSEAIRRGLVGKNFQFSKNYAYFFSAIEKVNSYFEQEIALRPKSLASEAFFKDLKLTSTAPEYLISDGGEFSWMLFLITKYGIVPEGAFPDTANSLNDDQVLKQLRKIVAATAENIATEIASFEVKKGGLSSEQLASLRKIKERGNLQAAKLLAETLGFPPNENSTFRFQVNQARPRQKPVYQEFTPKSFASYIGFDANNYVSISSTPEQAFNKAYVIRDHSSVGVQKPGDPDFRERFVNLNSARMLQLIKKSIDANKAVYFAADVTKDSDTEGGILDTRLYDEDRVLGMRTRAVGRRGAVNAGLYTPDHAMAIIGYESNKAGIIVRLKIRNSWGGRDFSMAVNWYKKYVFEATIEKQFLSGHEVDLAEDPKPVVIKSFDHYYGPY